MSQIRSNLKGESGAGSVLAIGFVAGACALLVACGAVTRLAVDRVWLQAHTDQIALMAEDSLRGLSTGFPCELAGQEAARFALTLDTCRILNSEAWIVLKYERLGIVMTARAHAGS